MVVIWSHIQQCKQISRALGDKLHDGDRWIAPSAMWLGCHSLPMMGLFDGHHGHENHKGPGHLGASAVRLKRFVRQTPVQPS
jgi:hypothetical protein